MQAIRNASNASTMFCAGAFVLLLATAISNFLRLDVDTGHAPFGEYMSQFMLPTIPLALALALLAMRSQVAATLVAGLGTLFYLAFWATLGF